MKQLLFLLCALMLITANLFAQDYAGFEEWKRGDMSTAKTEFQDLYNSKKTKLVGAFGLGLLYSDDRFSQKDLKRAYDYVTEARTMYRELKTKQKDDLKANGFKYTPVKTLREDIVNTVITEAKSKNTEEALNYALQNFKLPFETKKELFVLRNDAALETAKVLNSYSDYAKIYERYEKRDFERYTPEIANEIELMLFESFVAEKGYDKLDEFKTLHPKSPFVRGSTVDKFIEANKGNSPEKLEDYAQQYPSGDLAAIALRKAELLREAKSSGTIKNASKDQAWKELKTWVQPQLDSGYWEIAARKMAKYEAQFEGYAPFEDIYEILQRPSDKVSARKFPNINSPDDDYGISLTADNKTMYFCGDGRSDGVGSEDIFVSKLKNGEWSKPKVMREICTKLSEAPLSVTPDGTRILLYTGGGIAFSDKKSKGWSKPEKFPFPINAHDWQADAQMTPDGKGMILVIFKNKHTDIFYVPKKGTNKWGTLVNLGKTINTYGNERTPFLHPDNHTLYFSSDGHAGLGDLDVYMTTRQDDTWTNWSKPLNLGRNINSTGKDWGYKITTDGKRAFFSSGSPTQDLYEIDLPERYQPQPVNLITSNVGASGDKDKKIIVEDAETGELIGEFQADPETGEVIAIVPDGVKTTMRVEGDGVVSRPIEIEATTKGDKGKDGKDGEGGDNEVTLPGETKEMATTAVNLNAVDIEVAIAEGQTYSFPDLLFGYDSDVVNAAFNSELDQIAAALNESGTSIAVAGHTDDKGSDSYNNDLSQRRALAVKNYLVSKGIDPAKIEAIGYGESQPIADNDTKEGQAKNRRVEIIFKRP